MNNQPTVMSQPVTAAHICAHFNLEEETEPLLRDGMGPREFVEALLANKQYAAGIDFMAHALPSREAVWWGCLCLQHACGSSLSTKDKAAAKAALQWVLQPNEENRAAAKAPAEAAGPASPAGALARAAHWTGGSLGPPNGPPVPSKSNREKSPRPADYSLNWGWAWPRTAIYRKRGLNQWESQQRALRISMYAPPSQESCRMWAAWCYRWAA
jgi:hypothetical protein